MEKNRNFIILTLLAFVFSIAARYYWIYYISGVSFSTFLDHIMINTNDGYFYAEGARDILAGFHQPNDHSPVDTPLAKLTAFLYTILPFSFETLILWMPAFISSLIVVPIMIIARSMKQELLGFIAAILASIAWSYYNRTLVGYYDTDMLIVVLPMMVIAYIIYLVDTKDTKLYIIPAVFAMLSPYWHGGTLYMIHGFIAMLGLYILIFARKDIEHYKLITLLMLSALAFDIGIKFVLVFVVYFIYLFSKSKLESRYIISFAYVVALYYIYLVFYPMVEHILLNQYLLKDQVVSKVTSESLNYYGVLGTVSEAGKIPFETFANRISGSVVTFVLSVLGYILLAIRYPMVLLGLPMVVLGFFALQGGLRFTVFAIPFISLGMGYLIVLISSKIYEYKPSLVLRYIFVVLATLAVLYPNIKHIVDYKVQTVFNSKEVSALDQLGKIANREDYVVTWWDYGYPIRYYADVKTLVDGGKHDGGSNYPASYAIVKPQLASANMSRLAVEYTESPKGTGDLILDIKKGVGYTDTNKLLNDIQRANLNIAKSRDIYLYLPFRMARLIPTINLFSNLDITTGAKGKTPFYYFTQNYKDNGTMIDLGGGVSLTKKGGILNVKNQSVKLKQYITTYFDKSGKLVKKVQLIDPKGNMTAIFMKSYNAFIIVDEQMFNSTYVQLFALGKYNKKLFKPVIVKPDVFIYKVLR